MKVLKDGKSGDLKHWKVRVICRKQDQYDPDDGCGAELEVVASDLIVMYWHGTHFRHYYPGIKCPQCGHHFKVKDVPTPIWLRVNTDKNQEKALFDGFSESIY